MSLNYYLIKYMDDIGGKLQHTIGIIAHDGDKCHLRILGAKSRDEVDTAPFSSISELAAENAWAYLEWVDWFYSVSENECVNPAGFEKTMERLQTNGTSIVVELASGLEVPDGVDPASFVDQLYKANVSL